MTYQEMLMSCAFGLAFAALVLGAMKLIGSWWENRKRKIRHNKLLAASAALEAFTQLLLFRVEYETHPEEEKPKKKGKREAMQGAKKVKTGIDTSGFPSYSTDRRGYSREYNKAYYALPGVAAKQRRNARKYYKNVVKPSLDAKDLADREVLFRNDSTTVVGGRKHK